MSTELVGKEVSRHCHASQGVVLDELPLAVIGHGQEILFVFLWW